MRGIVSGAVRFLAGRDGIGHALPSRGRHLRAACGALLVDERAAWPARSHCAACCELAGLVPGSGLVLRHRTSPVAGREWTEPTRW